MNLAPRSQRLLGQLLDGFVGVAPMLGSVILLQINDTLGAIAAIGSILWMIFYYFFADGLHGGQSLGKQWLGMRVVNEDSGTPCSFGQSFIRNLLLAILGPIDWVFIFGERHQRLGDKAAGTIVVSV